MFPRGPRFEPVKISDVPGPNSYNVGADSQLDDYKRGAFLEKADRFSKEKESEVPGPGTYDVEPKKKLVKPSVNGTKPPPQAQNLVDRYAILQRKVEDLERVHNDGKKTYTSEIDRLKLELARSQKVNAEQADRLDKQKKQSDILDGRIQDLKKTAAIDQTELKDLRVKLRMSEHERTQIATKQGEAGELKKSLQLLESKRREEVRERDRRIAELEKAVATEKKKKEMAEVKLQDIKGKGDEELQAARATVQKLEGMVTSSQDEVRQTRAALTALQSEAESQEEALLAQLEQHRHLIGRVADEYGRLASNSIPAATHKLLEHRHAASHMRVLQLERKLANSEGQVVELANLIRQAKEQNEFLAQRLREAEDEIAFYSSILDASSMSRAEPDTRLEDVLNLVRADIVDSQTDIRNLDARTTELTSDFYRDSCAELLFEYSVVDKQLQQEQLISKQHAASLSSALASHEAIATRLESVQNQRTTIEGQLKAATDLAEKQRLLSESLVRQIEEVEEKMAETVMQSEAALKKEKDAVRRLNATVQKSRMAEDALRAEIEQLTTELTDAERYQEAYYSLSDEVGSLVTRNQLAEEEAQRLSTFNAEILGHNNPAQRIMYVDRIRRELAETKHKLVMLGREQENIVAVNEDLQHELDMYKSVMVPADQKPRTNLTRVGRPPLVNLNRSLSTSALGTSAAIGGKMDGSVEKASAQRVHVLETIPGDMTLDEII